MSNEWPAGYGQLLSEVTIGTTTIKVMSNGILLMRTGYGEFQELQVPEAKGVAAALAAMADSAAAARSDARAAIKEAKGSRQSLVEMYNIMWGRKCTCGIGLVHNGQHPGECPLADPRCTCGTLPREGTHGIYCPAGVTQ